MFKNKQTNNNKASKYIDEFIYSRRSELDRAVSFKWIYHGEITGLILNYKR